MSMRRQGDANDTIAAVFNMPGSRRLNPTLSGMSGFSATSNTFSERYSCCCLALLPGSTAYHCCLGVLPTTAANFC